MQTAINLRNKEHMRQTLQTRIWKLRNEEEKAKRRIMFTEK